MYNERERKLSEIACKLSSMAFVLNGCCENYEGQEIDTGKLTNFTKYLEETSLELFDLL